MKTQLSSLEIAALINEFQDLIGGKIDQIYQPNKKEFLISIHIPRKGKQLLKIQLPNFIFLTQQKPEMQPPSDFCLTLRKFLNNSTIKKIQQIQNERIIEIQLQKEEEFKLILELFSKGNLILTNNQNQILALLERQKWVTRELKIKETYQPPPPSFNLFKMNLQKLKQTISQSKKSKIITSLATEIGLGGTYAEEICQRISLNKNLSPKELTNQQIKDILNHLQNFLDQIKKPQGIVYHLKNINPFELKIYQDLSKNTFPTFNQALDSSLSKKNFEIEKEKQEQKFQEKINKIKHIVKEQKETIQKLGKLEQINTQKGNHVYEKYQEINTFLTKIKQAKQKLSWEDIKKELKKHKQIKNINLKEKKIILDV